jgi:hypothetical protein
MTAFGKEITTVPQVDLVQEIITSLEPLLAFSISGIPYDDR